MEFQHYDKEQITRRKGESLEIFPDEYVVIDIETTGYDASSDKIIELAALKVSDGTIVDSFQSLVNPCVPVDDFIVSLTGITNEMLSSAPVIEDILPGFKAFVGESILVGHNIHFDINFIYDNLIKYSGEHFENDFVDTLRLSRKYVKETADHKLSTLIKYFNIPSDTAHRALADCEATNKLYCILKDKSKDFYSELYSRLVAFDFGKIDTFKNKKIVIKGKTQAIPYEFVADLCARCGATPTPTFFKDSDVIIFGETTYRKYKRGDLSEKMMKADQLAKEKDFTILSEYEFYDMLGLSEVLPKPKSKTHTSAINIKELSTDKTEFDETHPLYGKMCVFTGTLEKMQRKDAMQMVLDFGGTCGNSVTAKTNYLILGNNDYCSAIKDGKSSKHKKAEELKLKGKDIEIIPENVFYDMVFDD